MTRVAVLALEASRQHSAQPAPRNVGSGGTSSSGIAPPADQHGMGDVEFTLYICDGCGSHAWLPEEVVHFNQQCRGKRDEEAITEVVLVPKARELVLV